MAHKNEEAVLSVTKSAEKFFTYFHKSLAGKNPGNFVSSALSAHTVLAMAAYGADGTTAQEMRKTLHLPDNDSHAHQGFQNFVDTINDTPKVTLKIANKIYAADDLVIKDQFKKITGTYFRSESENVDFGNNVKSAKAINGWCVEKTNGKIKELVKPDDLNNFTRMVLLNAVYFKGDWKEKFIPKLTENKPFHVDKSTTIQVPMMRTCEEFYYKKFDEIDAEVVALPYVNEDLYMVIIVPNEIDGLEKLEKNFKKVHLEYQNFGYREEVNLSLPKFKVESTHDLENPLIELGVNEIFTEKANFKNMCDENVYVSKVIQKAFIEVNEEGSEAAAVTAGVQMLCSLIIRPPPVELIINRPFTFMIVYKKMTLFSGHVFNPLK